MAEKYEPTQEDIKKAEDSMGPEQVHGSTERDKFRESLMNGGSIYFTIEPTPGPDNGFSERWSNYIMSAPDVADRGLEVHVLKKAPESKSMADRRAVDSGEAKWITYEEAVSILKEAAENNNRIIQGFEAVIGHYSSPASKEDMKKQLKDSLEYLKEGSDQLETAIQVFQEKQSKSKKEDEGSKK
ncbi:MAG: hypothetical protein KBC81_02155 [Candidatus Pacebacteria bacterium]|nr:hypothetical protein [Candidatus Paceibacterota bacterium]